MSLNNLLNQFLGASDTSQEDQKGQLEGLSNKVSNLANGIPGGLAGGAAAGGLMALLMSNKSARKYAGKAAKYGGAAMLGGLAFKGYQNWSSKNPSSAQSSNHTQQPGITEARDQQAIKDYARNSHNDMELTVIIKAMIAAAKADGHIDAKEQQHIFQAVEKMNLSAEEKGIVFDSLQKDISIHELVSGIDSLEIKTEIYLASCLVIDLDQPSERKHLDELGSALALPKELLQQIEWQAEEAYTDAA